MKFSRMAIWVIWWHNLVYDSLCKNRKKHFGNRYFLYGWQRYISGFRKLHLNRKQIGFRPCSFWGKGDRASITIKAEVSVLFIITYFCLSTFWVNIVISVMSNTWSLWSGTIQLQEKQGKITRNTLIGMSTQDILDYWIEREKMWVFGRIRIEISERILGLWCPSEQKDKSLGK